MSSLQYPVFRSKRLLQREIALKQKYLDGYKLHIDFENEKPLSVLEAMKTEKEEAQKNLFWFQYWAKGTMPTVISDLQRRINQLKDVEKLERELEELKELLFDFPGQGWGGYPGTLDDKIVVEYRNKFKKLTYPLTTQVPLINIVMIGETGSGKSSFLRTFTTALTDSTDIKDIYRVAPVRGREISVTKRIHLEPINMGDKGMQLPCQFYDMPGIDKNETIKREDIEKIVNGTIKLDVNVHKVSEIEFESPANEIHCILYVINAKTNLTSMPESLKVMTEILQSKNEEDGVRQFVVVTSIDQLGVPNDNMKNAYKYPCVRDYCEEVSEAFGVDLLHVIPVSNYFEEVATNDAKNAMSLFNLWRVFNSGKEYIDRRWNKKDTRYFQQGLLCTKQ